METPLLYMWRCGLARRARWQFIRFLPVTFLVLAGQAIFLHANARTNSAMTANNTMTVLLLPVVQAAQ